MRTPALILAVVAAALLPAPARPQDNGSLSRKERATKPAKKINDLQKERIDTLKAMADVSARLFRSGHATIEAAVEARVLVIEAELDAAREESRRITLYKTLVDVLKQYEEVAQARVKTARGTEASVLKIKARRLEAEIRLEQANARTPEPEQHTVVGTSPRVKDVILTRQYACRILARRHIKIRSLQSGYLEAIPVKEGQTVKKGEVLFKIAPTLYRARLDAEFAEARLAQIELNDAKRKFDDKVISQNELARFQAKMAKAQAKARLAEADLDFTLVKAPFDGIIDRLREQEGSLVTERDTLTTLSDNSVMWVYFNVPQARYLEYVASPVADKQGLIELVLANGTKFKQGGRIGAVEAEFDEANGNVPFRADFPNPEGLLRHGMAGRVLTRRTLKNALVIPRQATFELAGKRFVYVLDKEGVAHQREIVVQHEVEDVFVITKGVGVDDRIAVEGVRQIRDGEKVEYEFRPPA